jgi:glycosyltransferase involved in cell wall biosynthesis
MPDRPLRILFTVPAYWPAVAYGGPVWITRELVEELARRGHSVDVMTTSLVDLDRGLSLRTRMEELGGVRVHRLATPVRYRWMGVPTSLPLVLRRLARPDIVHLIGYRDPLGLGVATWCRLKGIPYLLEPMGMYRPRVRKQRLKRALDPLLPQRIARAAALVMTDSELERDDLVEAGLPRDRLAVRPSPFPPLREGRSGLLRERLGLTDEPLVLYVGRMATGKGIELLLEALRDLGDAHLALVGPSDHAEVGEHIARAAADGALAGRVHVLPAWRDERPLALYGDADVFVLASTGKNENFGLVVAEAVSAGTPVVVTDQAGVAELVKDRAGLVVPPTADAVREAVARILEDGDLRARLRSGAAAVAQENSASAVVERQEAIYRSILGR